MPVQAVETRRLYRQIADQIEALIASGEFGRGDRLPPERDLAAKLGVSRATVREAMIALELAGLVDIRIGAGIFVSKPPPRSHAANGRRRGKQASDDPGPGPFELVDARRAIESGVAALAATNRTAAELDAVAQAVKALRRAVDDGSSGEAADRAFHAAVAEATHNAVLARTVADLWSWRQGPMWTRLHAGIAAAPLGRRWLADHERILRAIRRQDPDSARAAMEAHLLGVKEELLRAMDA